MSLFMIKINSFIPTLAYFAIPKFMVDIKKCVKIVIVAKNYVRYLDTQTQQSPAKIFASIPK